MPWESKIKSERLRHVVLAGIMLALLGIATGMAMLMSQSRAELVGKLLGDFELKIPKHWREIELDDTDHSTMLAAYVTNQPSPHGVFIKEYSYAKSTSPRTTFYQLLNDLALDPSQFSTPGIFRTNTIFGVQTNGIAITLHKDNKLEHHLIMVMTLDGLAHLTIHMRGPTIITLKEAQQLSTIIHSVEDVRYNRAENPIELGQIAIEVPKGLTAWQHIDPQYTGTVQLIPNSTVRIYREQPFFKLTLSQLLIDDVLNELDNETSHSPVEPIDNNQTSDEQAPLPKQSKTEIAIMRAIANRYMQNNNQSLSPNGIGKIGDKIFYRIELNTTENEIMQRAVWAVQLDEQTVLAIEEVAHPNSLKASAVAIQQLIQKISLAQPKTENTDS